MKDDLISREGVINTVKKVRNVCDTESLDDYRDLLVECFEVLPPAHPEIVRCKDCKHYYFADNRIPQEQRYTCELDGDRWNPDSFCSFAERRER